MRKVEYSEQGRLQWAETLQSPNLGLKKKRMNTDKNEHGRLKSEGKIAMRKENINEIKPHKRKFELWFTMQIHLFAEGQNDPKVNTHLLV